MKKNVSLSPIATIEQLLFEKLGNTEVRTWHYLTLLTLLFIAPLALPNTVFTNPNFFIIFVIIAVLAWMSSRLVGRQLSKTSSIDSVLIYRFFAAISWILPTLSLALTSIIGVVSSPSNRQLLLLTVCVSTVVSLLHIAGIIIHFRGMSKQIRNVNKEDLFQ